MEKTHKKQKYSQVRVEKDPQPILRYLWLTKRQKVFMTDGEKTQKKTKVESSKSGKISSTGFKIFMADEKAGQSFYRGRSPRGAVQKIAVYNLLPGFRVLSIPK